MVLSRYVYLAFMLVALGLGLAGASAALAVMTGSGQPDHLVGGVVALSTLIGVAFGVAVFFILLRNTRAVTFTNEAIGELVKVTWPSREETITSATVVVVVSTIFSGALALFDFAWARITELFLYTSG